MGASIVKHGFARIVAASVVALGCASNATEPPEPVALTSAALLPAGWQGADVGATGAVGSESYSGTTYTITGAGTGIGSPQAPDAFHFTYTTLTGDFTLVARVASFNGAANSSVGLMARQDNTGMSAAAGVFFQPSFPGGVAPSTNRTVYFGRAPNSHRPWTGSGMFTPIAAPIYLKLVRLGGNFAVYRSSNGTIWSQVGSNQSGGAFSASGPIEVGLAVASGSSATAQATVDNVTLKPTGALDYESSWVGNSLGSDSTEFVTGTSTALYVAPDGTCVTNGGYDEAGEPAKIYKNGAVVKPIDSFPAGGSSYEGSVTGDGTFLYLFGRYSSRQEGIFQTDMNGSASSTVPIYFANRLMDAYPVGNTLVSGMAAGNGELYVSNATANKVFVANPSQTMLFGGPRNSFITVSSAHITGITTGVPEAVYQTQREADGIPYTLPGFTSNGTYSVRLHFAVLNTAAKAGTYSGNFYVNGQSTLNFDPYVKAGNAVNAASTYQFNNVIANSSGQIQITIERALPAPTMFINAIEVLTPSGAPVFQLDAGGGQSGAWKSDVHELVGRAFSFTRPGPIAVDKRGNLWIVQEGTTFPAAGSFTSTPNWAAIKLYSKAGKYLNKQITDVVNPTALAYDSDRDRLLVAEAGPAQNIRIYTGLTGTPTLSSTFGQSVFSKSPGLLFDSANGGNARFQSPTGVGIDHSGNIYVSSFVGGGTDLRAFTAQGSLLWSKFALEFCNTGDFLPSATSGIAPDIYTPTKHYKLNLNSVGNEWSLYSYLWNPFKYGVPPRGNNSSSVVRTIGAQRQTIIYTAGQGVVGAVGIFRVSNDQSGEQMVPAGSYDGIKLWLDNGNGGGIANDGIEQTGEDTTGSPFGFESFDVDLNGNIILIGGASQAPLIRKLNLSGVSASGVPNYSVGNFVDRVVPAPFSVTGARLKRVKYDAVGDSMYVMGATNPDSPNDGSHEYTSTLARYDGWSTGTPTTRYAVALPTPATDPNFMYSKPYPYNLSFDYEAMDVVPPSAAPAGRVFIAEMWGPVHVFDANTGAQITVLVPGPEVSGNNAWEDQVMGVRAGYNSTRGEYEILSENSGYQAKENFFRWKAPLPFTVTASSTYPGASYALPNGYDGVLTTYWMTYGNSDNEGHDDTPWIQYRFDKSYTLRTLHVSNYNTGEWNRGMKDVDVQVSTNGTTFTSIGMKQIQRGSPTADGVAWQDIDLGGVQALAVKLVVHTNWYGATFYQGISYEGAFANASITGLSDVQFFAQ